MSCPICCDSNETHKICPSCDDQCCLVCFQKYIVSLDFEPFCMFCKKPLSLEWVMTLNPRHWIKNILMPHLAKLRQNQELNLLIYDQEQAKTILKVRELRYQISQLPLIRVLKKRHKNAVDLQQMISKVRVCRNSLQDEIRILTRCTQNKKPRQDTKFYGFCPVENCKGYIGCNFQCMLCDEKICSHCGEKDHENKKCNPEIMKNFKTIQHESKPCPQCKVPIYQSSGCSQMWCVLCQTPFDWHSGKKIDGVIHNPHYYEWLNSNNQQSHQPNLNCMEFPTAQQLVNFIHHHAIATNDGYFFHRLHRIITHLQNIVFPTLRLDRIPNNQSLRIQYLVGDIDKARWLELLQYREERRMKLNALYLITDLAIQLFSDLISKLIQDPKNPPTKDEFKKIWNFIQEGLERCCKIYGGSVPSTWVDTIIQIELL